MEASAYKMQIGDRAHNFAELPGVDGKAYSLYSFKDKKLLTIVWHCNHCPYAQAFEARFIDVAHEYGPRGVGFIAINSNDARQYPEDSFEEMGKRARANQYPFPYVFDESQDVALQYGAVCTPHVFVFDEDRKLRYQGRFDGERHDPKKGNAQDLRNALDDLLAGTAVRTPTTRAFGCSVKWKETTLVKLRR